MKYLFILLSFVFLLSCDRARQKAKHAVNKTGEVVAEAGSEFADGISKGVEKSFSNELVISGELTGAGLKAGKVSIVGTDSTTDNVLRVYLIFDNAIDRTVTVKVFDRKGQEYGRVAQPVHGRKGEAVYTDFVFDRRTNIDGKGKITFE
ncbi:MAG: hypothetical protein ABW019_17205 [Chitinophagaceae bacterium]